MRLKTIVPNTPLEDNYSKEKLQPDDEIIIPQNDLYTISWEANFDYQVFEPRKDDKPNEKSQTPGSNASGTTGVYVIYDNADDDAIRPGTATSRDGIILRGAHDVTEVNERTSMNKNEARPRRAISRDAPMLYDKNDLNDNTANNKQRSEIKRPSTDTSQDNPNLPPTDLRNEIDDSTRYSPIRGEDNPVPGIPDNVNIPENEKKREVSCPRGEKYNLQPNPTAN